MVGRKVQLDVAANIELSNPTQCWAISCGVAWQINKQIIITDMQECIVKNGLGIIPSDFTKIMDSAFRGCNKEHLPQKFHNIIQEMVPEKKVKE